MKYCTYALMLSVLLLFPTFASAQETAFCKQINSLFERLFSNPLLLHGQDQRRERLGEGASQFLYTISKPSIVLESSEECELSTSDGTIEGENLKSFNYQCRWPQNRGTSQEESLRQGSELASGIAACTGTNIQTQDTTSRARWFGRIKRSTKSIAFEVRVPKGLRNQSINLEIKGEIK